MNIGISVPLPAYHVDVGFMSRKAEELGIGGGCRRAEPQIMSADFDHRWTQTRESILAMKELWTKPAAEFHGKYYDFPPVKSFPKPLQKPHPPVLLGGGAKNVLQRVVA